jgi:excisionase family DNA binding protein
MSERLVYTVSEACAVARVGRTTIYKAIQQKQLRAVKWGRRTLILAESLHARFKDLLALEAGDGRDPGSYRPEGAPSMTDGGRNAYLTSIASQLRRNGATRGALLTRLREENAKACSPPLSDDEVVKIVERVSK